MKLKIENWIESNMFSDDVNMLLNDSVICYKAGANRASLLFSYLGFLTILKERLLNATRPALFPESHWTAITRNLRNEDSWEKAIFEATQMRESFTNDVPKVKSRDAIFAMNENLRIQILYWKDRRNDCAHFKHNAIEGHHVDSFWSFLQSNLPKMTVEGGMQTLITKILNHFNPILTAPDADYTPLVKEIENATESFKLKEFWEKLLTLGEYDFELGTSRKSVINKSFEINDSKTNDALLEILTEKSYLRKDFLNTYPEKLVYFNFNPQDVRKFWNIEINQMHNPLSVYAVMLRNNMIPQGEITEAHGVIISKLRKYEVTPTEHLELQSNKFFESFKELVFNSNRFEEYLWVNERADLIAAILKHYPLDIEVVNRICYVYGLSTNSQWLLERFNNLFLPGAYVTTKFQEIITQNAIVVPAPLQKYFT